MFGLNKSYINKKLEIIRKENKDKSIHDVVKIIKKHYITNVYSEKELLLRINKLKAESFFEENIIAGSIGALMGIVLGDIEYFQKACPKYKFFCFVFLIIVTTTVAALVMFVLKKIYLSIHYYSAYNEYLDEKEIKIIKSIIDNRGKEKRSRVKTRRRHKYFRNNY